MDWDEDIARLTLTDEENNGLKVYLNYSKSFDNAREQKFALEIDGENLSVDRLSEVLKLVQEEDVKFVPVIASAFADEELEAMFRRYIPEGVPGGKKAMLGRFGPISSLFNRIQFSFAFDMLSRYPYSP
jgi:hypothetical protein